jgi:hypothetical protein
MVAKVRYIIVAFSFFLQTLSGLGQNRILKPLEVDTSYTDFRWTVFVTADTTYQVTKYINEVGRFYFSRDFEDTTILLNKREYLLASEGSFFVKKPGYYLLINRFIEGIDTIYHYSDEIVRYPPQEEIKTKDGIIFLKDLLLEDIKFSYLFREFSKNSEILLDFSDLVLLYPDNDLNPAKEYSLLVLKNKGETFDFFFYSGNSEDLSGFKINRKDYTVVPLKKMKKLLEDLKKIDTNNSEYCLRPRNPWLFIYKNQSYVMANYCITENNEKKLLYFFRLFSRLQSLRNKNFRNSSRFRIST